MRRDERERDSAAIGDMLAAMHEAAMHVAGLTKDGAASAPHPRDAALYRILVLGEAAGRVSAATRSRHEDVPWADIVAMRNIIIHGYEKVDWDVVWEAIHHDFPQVEPLLRRILEELG